MTLQLLRPIRSFLRRDRGERRLLIEALLVVTASRAALTLVPYALLRRARRPVLGIAARLPAGPARTPALVSAVRVVSRHVPGATCLTQAIALHLMLVRRRIASHLVVGVARRDGRFQAHAWVDRDGEVLIGGDVAGFNPLLRVGRSGR